MARGIRDSAVFKNLRKALGLEATELADLLGVTAKTISRWKTGHREEERHRLTLEAWADGLGTRKPRPPPRR
jgi:transcriptional regulator with XRE-family HTH domain